MALFDPKHIENLVPVQIIGTQRSGSNLLRLMLNQVNEIFAPHPPHILATFYPLLSYYGDLSNEGNFRQLVTDICDFIRLNAVPWKESLLDPGFIMAHCQQRTLLEAYRKIYELNAIHKKKHVWINKSMQNVYFIDEFERNGFSPLLIHLVRDGRDVSLSFKRTIVGEKHIYYLASQWKKDQEMADYHLNRYGPSRAIRVRYEDLLTNPGNEVRRICAFLKVPFTNRVFTYYDSAESRLTARSGEMWTNLAKPIISDNFNKYRSVMDRSEIEIFEIIASHLLQQYGYTLETKPGKQDYTFSDDEIASFDRMNELYKKKMLEMVSPEELHWRRKQQQFISSIKERVGIV